MKHLKSAWKFFARPDVASAALGKAVMEADAIVAQETVGDRGCHHQYYLLDLWFLFKKKLIIN